MRKTSLVEIWCTHSRRLRRKHSRQLASSLGGIGISFPMSSVSASSPVAPSSGSLSDSSASEAWSSGVGWTVQAIRRASRASSLARWASRLAALAIAVAWRSRPRASTKDWCRHRGNHRASSLATCFQWLQTSISLDTSSTSLRPHANPKIRSLTSCGSRVLNSSTARRRPP